MARLEKERGGVEGRLLEEKGRVEARRKRVPLLPVPSSRVKINIWKETTEASEDAQHGDGNAVSSTEMPSPACGPGLAPPQKLRAELGR